MKATEPTFKEEMINSFIPAIARMIEKEELHLCNLKIMEVKFNRRSNFNIFSFMIDKPNFKQMIKTSEYSLNHLKQRYKEYLIYIETL